MKIVYIILVFITYVITPLSAQTIVNKPNSEIFQAPTFKESMELQARYLLYSESTKRENKKSNQFEVIGYANISLGFHYDSYVIRYLGEYYCLSKEYVLDNSLINEKIENLMKNITISPQIVMKY